MKYFTRNIKWKYSLTIGSSDKNAGRMQICLYQAPRFVDNDLTVTALLKRAV